MEATRTVQGTGGIDGEERWETKKREHKEEVLDEELILALKMCACSSCHGMLSLLTNDRSSSGWISLQLAPTGVTFTTGRSGTSGSLATGLAAWGPGPGCC